MKTTIQIKTIRGKLLFEFEKEDNSIKKTVIEAVKQGADLQGADLQGANLRGPYLKNIYSKTTILPEGDLIIWKKLQKNKIAKCLVPAKAKRVNAIGSRKCRFEYVKVIAIYDGGKKVNEGIGKYGGKTKYTVGEITKSDSFDDSPLIECSNGIHGFITRQEAEEY
jgi:hypothetical protein